VAKHFGFPGLDSGSRSIVKVFLQGLRAYFRSSATSPLWTQDLGGVVLLGGNVEVIEPETATTLGKKITCRHWCKKDGHVKIDITAVEEIRNHDQCVRLSVYVHGRGPGRINAAPSVEEGCSGFETKSTRRSHCKATFAGAPDLHVQHMLG
jgi:hypothetical protein